MRQQVSDGILIGKIGYTNVWPVYHHFRTSQFSASAELVTEVPSILNRKLLEGSMDVSAISSFAYGVGHEDLLLLPQLSVSTNGPVNSIFVFSREPLERIKNGVFSLTNTSATSVNLLKMIMEKKYGGKPTYVDSEPDLEAMMANSDAALLIGDTAIKASWQDHGYIMTDLSQLWKTWTGYGMTFAVWVVTKRFADRKPELVAEVLSAFQTSKQRSLADLSPVVAQACQEIGGNESYWTHYFKNLCYDFGEEQQAGLALYYSYAHELGLLDHKVPLNIWSNNKLIRVKE